MQTLTISRSRDDEFGASLRGFGPAAILAMAVILTGNAIFLPGSAVLVLLWVWRSRTPWREIGYAPPANWTGTIAFGLLFGVGFKMVMKAVVMPLLGAPETNQAYQYLAGNRPAIPYTLYAMVVGAGFGEETVFRGYLFERLGKLLGTGAGAKLVIVLFTSTWFGLDHYAIQGLAGAEQATIVGLVFGTIMAVTGRLWGLMIAHAAFDLTAYAIIYWGLESAAAHLIF